MNGERVGYSLSVCGKFLDMAANTANTERFVSLTYDDVDKFLETDPEENKNTQKRPQRKKFRRHRVVDSDSQESSQELWTITDLSAFAMIC